MIARERTPASPGADDSAQEAAHGTDWLQLADWRRRVGQLYAEIRELRTTDPPAAHEHWQSTRNELFSAHPQTPLTARGRTTFTGLRVSAYDPDFAFTAALERDVGPSRFPVGTSGAGVIDFVRVGRVGLPFGTLDVYWLDAYGGGLFLPFRDASSGKETYGGGRYVLDTVKGADLGVTDDGELVLDFNFAYHPSCHYAPAWSCPLAPPDNWLSERVSVGEQA